MSNIIKRKLSFFLVIGLVFMIVTAMLAYDEGYIADADSPTIVDTDVSEASSGCVMLALDGDYYAQQQEALDYINQLRKEACEAGNVPDPRNYSRMLQPSDYVPIKWSTALERATKIRATEAGLAYSFLGSGHSRLNGKFIMGIAQGISPYAECIAYNFSKSMVYGIDQWLAEKTTWVNGGSGVTGHYTQMIDPSNTYVGLGGFYSSYSSYPGTLVAQYSSTSASVDESYLPVQTNVRQKIDVLEKYLDYYYVKGQETLYLDDTQIVAVRAHLVNGTRTLELTIPDTISFESSNTEVATVSADGLVTPKAKGTTVISATASGRTIRALTVKVDCNHNYVNQSYQKATCVMAGSASYKCSKCGDTKTEVLPINDNHDYSFDETDEEGYANGVCSLCKKAVRILPPTRFGAWWWNGYTGYGGFPSGVTVGSVVQYDPYGADGDEDFRTVVIESSNNKVIESNYDVPMSKETDFAIKSNGIATLKAYLKYNPSVYKTYTVRIGEPGCIDIAGAKIELKVNSFTYSGYEIKPSITVSYEGTELSSGIDYTTSYTDNINAGTGSITITGEGIFGGSKTVNFTISPRNIAEYSISLETSSYEYDGTAKTPTVKVYSFNKTLVSGVDYTVSYQDNDIIGTATAVATGKGNYTGTVSKTFKQVHTTHKYGDAVVEKASSCTETGLSRTTCIFCDYNYTTTIAKSPHTSVVDKVVAPTFTSKGYTQYVCKACGYSYKDNYVNVLEPVKLDITAKTIATCDTFLIAANYSDLYWSSSDEKIASVDQNGLITANRFGKVTITATSPDGASSASCVVNILFNDVAGSADSTKDNYQYYYNPVYWAANKGITTGNDGVNFGVGEDCTRAAVMIFLWRYNGSPEPKKNAQYYFNDLSSYSKKTATNKAIAWAYEQGITKGYSDGSFGVKKSIERKDVLIILYRLAGKPRVTGSMKFSDCAAYKKGSDTYNAIVWGASKKITSGYDDGTFGPTNNCLREQIITFLYRYNKL